MPADCLPRTPLQTAQPAQPAQPAHRAGEWEAKMRARLGLDR